MSVQSGGNKPPDLKKIPSLADQHLPGQVAGSPAWAGPGALGGNANNRTFQQIIEDEKKNRNIVEIQLIKLEDSQRPLTFDDLGEMIFDVLKIDPKDCISFNYNTALIFIIRS